MFNQSVAAFQKGTINAPSSSIDLLTAHGTTTDSLEICFKSHLEAETDRFHCEGVKGRDACNGSGSLLKDLAFLQSSNDKTYSIYCGASLAV